MRARSGTSMVIAHTSARISERGKSSLSEDANNSRALLYIQSVRVDTIARKRADLRPAVFLVLQLSTITLVALTGGFLV